MLISEEFYQQLHPSFQKMINELEEELSKEENFKEYLIQAYSMEYLLPKEYWDFVYSVEKNHNENFWKEISERAYYHFYYSEEKQYMKNSEYVYDSDYDVNKWRYVFLLKRKFKYNCDGTRDLYYPNIYLKEAFYEYEKNLNQSNKYFYETGERAMYASTKTCRKKVDDLIKLCEAIQAAENNEDLTEWFDLVIQSNHIDFIYANVNLKLCNNLLNVQLWKLYIDYLHKTDTEAMLHLYSKYCRFFTDDTEMKEKYKEEMAKYGPIKVKWDNLFDFEKAGKNVEVSQEKFIQRRIERKKYFDTFDDYVRWDNTKYDSDVLSNYYSTFKFQDFSLPKPLITYILDQAPPTVLRKLFASCKYFFYRKPTPLCYRFEATTWNDKSKYFSFCYDNVLGDYETVANIFIKKYYITTTLYLKNDRYGEYSNISPILSKIYRCDAKYIMLWGQKLTYSDLKFLIQSGNVIKLLMYSKVRMDDDEAVAMEDIMKYLPNIAAFVISDKIKINTNTISILNEQNFFAKIYRFHLYNIIGEEFDPIEFRNFIVNNKEKYLQLQMKFSEKCYSPLFVEDIKTVMKDLIDDVTTNEIEIGFRIENSS